MAVSPHLGDGIRDRISNHIEVISYCIEKELLIN
jgi:hypothetical protein